MVFQKLPILHPTIHPIHLTPFFLDVLFWQTDDDDLGVSPTH